MKLTTLALGAVLLFSGSAFAQDYTVTHEAGHWVDPPSDATSIPIGLWESRQLDLPFTFSYFGWGYDKVWFHWNGYLQFGVAQAAAGQRSSFPQPLPIDAATDTEDGDKDGIVAVRWGQYPDMQNVGGVDERKLWWTEGEAPNRRVIAAWLDRRGTDLNADRMSFEVQLFESTGRIVFAYRHHTNEDYGNNEYLAGIDAPFDEDLRFALGSNNVANNRGVPALDIRFDPDTVEFTGRALYDHLVSGASGIGTSVLADQPLAGIEVQLLRAGTLAGATYTDESGDFTLLAVAIPAGESGGVRIRTRSPAATVVPSSTGDPLTVTYSSSLDLDDAVALDAFTLDSTADPTGELRAAFHIATCLVPARTWFADEVGCSLASLRVLYETTAPTGTLFNAPSGGGAPVLRIGSDLAANPDGWDVSSIYRAYSRYGLACLAPYTSSTFDDRYDVVTDDHNAFASGFGLAVAGRILGTATLVDGVTGSTGRTYQLESPTFASARRADVNSRVAAMLYDLWDPADESHDRIDGTADPDRVFDLLRGMIDPPTAPSLFAAWDGAGYDLVTLTRNYIFHGLIADDDSELNDDASEAYALGSIGGKSANRVLTTDNEDWYSVSLPSGVSNPRFEARIVGSGAPATLQLELRSGAGGVLGTATAARGGNAASIAPAPLSAGTYLLRVSHVSGASIPSYTVQASVPPTLSVDAISDWTVGQPYARDLVVTGGIPGYAFNTGTGQSLPSGLSFRPSQRQLAGTPTAAGTWSFDVVVSDGGDPAHVVARSAVVTIHPKLVFSVADLLPFAAGRPSLLPRLDSGGMPPVTLSLTSGELPEGLTFAGSGLRFDGAPIATGETHVAFAGQDAAGSADSADALALVCAPLDVKNSPFTLGEDAEAAGWWIDAVAGSVLKVKTKTAKKRDKRLLAVRVVGPDALDVGDLASKAGLGKASVTYTATRSGRQYVIFPAGAGPETELQATASLKSPTRAGRKLTDFAQGSEERIEVGAVAGATLTLTVKLDKKAGMQARVAALLDPSGAPTSLGGRVTTKGTKLTLKSALTVGGTWTVILEGTAGAPGKLIWKASIKQPRGAAYSAEE